MIKYKIKTSNSLSELQSKSISFHHDHAHHIYFGKTKNLPEKLKYYSDEKPYIFIFWEDEPMN